MREISESETQSEVKAVAILSEAVALEYGADSDTAKQIYITALLHDIGKNLIPGRILNKPDKLTAEEFEIMKTHTVLGASLLSSVQGNIGIMARLATMYHHETYNAEKSYWGMRSCELPEYVRIITIVDVFCALLHTRVYKSAWNFDEAVEYIHSGAGTHFDPELVKVFLPLVRHDNRLKPLLASIR